MIRESLKSLAAAVLRHYRWRRVETVVTINKQGGVVERPEWEMVADTPESWGDVVGWNHQSIVARQVEKWDAFLESLERAQPLGRPHEAAPDAPLDVSPHNTIMTFAYLLGRIAAERSANPPSVLDWGGGLGHYWHYAKVLFPNTDWNYVIKDLPGLCDEGSRRSPGARFVSDESMALSRSYDLVFASSSLHYTRDVYGQVARLCNAADKYFFVTRTPFVEDADDFVVVQRPHRYGYLTEYAGWFLNRKRFHAAVNTCGFVLDREFLLAERPYVGNAPEQCRYCGFLFKRVDRPTAG